MYWNQKWTKATGPWPETTTYYTLKQEIFSASCTWIYAPQCKAIESLRNFSTQKHAGRWWRHKNCTFCMMTKFRYRKQWETLVCYDSTAFDVRFICSYVSWFQFDAIYWFSTKDHPSVPDRHSAFLWYFRFPIGAWIQTHTLPNSKISILLHFDSTLWKHSKHICVLTEKIRT